MFLDLIDLPIRSDKLSWSARQVVRDIDGEPHLMLRVSLRGTRFEHRALGPFVRAGELETRMVKIADDGLTAHAYFDRPIRSDATIEFGYEDTAYLRFPGRYAGRLVRSLDFERIPKGTRFVERFRDQEPR